MMSLYKIVQEEEVDKLFARCHALSHNHVKGNCMIKELMLTRRGAGCMSVP